ncbi:MAG: starch-binding protein, partial [Clostridia bacterium]|nr:starch-binding protein [Clostridia bacterium]
GITVYYKSSSGTTPYVYYWNSLPKNLEVEYPGKAMTEYKDGWYSYTIDGVDKVNVQFIEGDKRSPELTKSAAGEYWYDGSKWVKDPFKTTPTPGNYERTDMRQDSIYFVITTRFYDGDTGNNVHCWDDAQANNPDSDPAWRGDFQGLIDKLDYIKALGFSAIWITPVVENCSGYDYHGYHALDFSKVDPRYESEGATYQDLINAAHEKDIKIIQDVVWNHSSNFGEAFLAPMFHKEYESISDLGSADCVVHTDGSKLLDLYPNYDSMQPGPQFQARLAVMKEDANDTKNYYHHEKNLSYGSHTEQTGQMAGDCVDINTENPEVAQYLVDTFMDYVNMGVDCFRFDTEKHINRWTLNSAYFPEFAKVDNFYIFGEVCSRRREVMNEGGPSDSCFFYTWAEPSSSPSWSTTDWKSNYDISVAQYGVWNDGGSFTQRSDNAFLNGNAYHTPDYSQANGTGVIDFPMHWNFMRASDAFNTAKGGDSMYNDATWNVVYVDSHDYSPDDCQRFRYTGGEAAWAENMSLMFTFRGIPCIYYGSEVQFMAGAEIDVGPNAPLAKTGRAYFGDYLEGTVTASDFGEYTASGTVQETLNNPLAKHVTRLNQIRRAVPALQMGQYSTEGCGSGMAYKRRYTANGVDSYALVTVSGGTTFTGVENGTYVEVVTGKTVSVSGGTLTTDSIGQGNMRCYVLQTGDGLEPTGKIGTDGAYLK